MFSHYSPGHLGEFKSASALTVTAFKHPLLYKGFPLTLVKLLCSFLAFIDLYEFLSVEVYYICYTLGFEACGLFFGYQYPSSKLIRGGKIKSKPFKVYRYLALPVKIITAVL